MKYIRSSVLLLSMLVMTLFASFASADEQVGPEAYTASLDLDGMLDLAPVAGVGIVPAAETIYITARDIDLAPMLVAIETLRPLTAGIVEFVVITSSASPSVTATGGC